MMDCSPPGQCWVREWQLPCQMGSGLRVPIEQSLQFHFVSLILRPYASGCLSCCYFSHSLHLYNHGPWFQLILRQSQHDFYYPAHPGLQSVGGLPQTFWGQVLILSALESVTSCRFRVLRTVSYDVLSKPCHRPNAILSPKTLPWQQDSYFHCFCCKLEVYWAYGCQ